MSQSLVIFGAGGHARVVASTARRCGWHIAAILDRKLPGQPELIDGVAVSGPFEQAARYVAAGVHHAALAVGDNGERELLFAELSRAGFIFPVLQHPTAIVEDNAQIGPGTLICAGAIIGALVKVGCDAIVNTGAIIDHECVIGDHVHVAPGSCVAGRVTIGTGTMLGIGSSVSDKVCIGARSTIGAGSVVVTNIPDSVIAYGCPAKVSRKVGE
jgi:UDP-perosamine 4-acetyltransferase